jgi:hypothetical protein
VTEGSASVSAAAIAASCARGARRSSFDLPE